jgi:uncharacterized metal-binding protein
MEQFCLSLSEHKAKHDDLKSGRDSSLLKFVQNHSVCEKLVMPRGKVHFAIEATVGIVIGAALLHPKVQQALPPWAAYSVVLSFCGGYLFSLFWISPDLDLARNKTRQRWGVFGMIWTPYDWIFRHRGLSHSVVFGTLTRLIYLFLILILPVLILQVYFGVLPAGAVHPTQLFGVLPELIAFVVGCYLPDLLHVAADKVL